MGSEGPVVGGFDFLRRRFLGQLFQDLLDLLSLLLPLVTSRGLPKVIGWNAWCREAVEKNGADNWGQEGCSLRSSPGGHKDLGTLPTLATTS